jgi:D-alanyl-D-alanine carboxypeptidase (penicillin-binding protein 5/6)
VLVPGSVGKLPWPAKGEGALAVQGVGLIAHTVRQPEVPIASVTKVMTAYIVLEDHPLGVAAAGPVLTMTEADAQKYTEDSEQNDSSVMVVKGEQLDERQLLEALLIPSADNIADVLAVWDAGSISAFVTKMNATAEALGLTSTHYTDPSGLDPGNQSTAIDQAELASVVMAIPAFASIVKLSHARLPVAGTVWGYNPAIGIDGVVGVKSGFTSHAQACLIAAADRTIDGHAALLISVVLGQPLGLDQAADEDLDLLGAVTKVLGVHHVVAPGESFATAGVPWTKRADSLVADNGFDLVTWPGLSYSVAVNTSLGGSAWQHADKKWVIRSGTEAGLVEVRVGGSDVASVPLRLSAPLYGPPPGWTAPASAS